MGNDAEKMLMVFQEAQNELQGSFIIELNLYSDR
jgi:hypothetical protein